MDEIAPFATQDEALARLDVLNQQRVSARQHHQHVLDEIKAVLAVAGAQDFDRSTLIEHSGLSRRTAYQVLPPRSAADE